MKRQFHTHANSLAGLKPLAVLLAVAMLAASLFVPTFAAEPAVGYSTGNSTVYTAADAVGATAITASGADSVWKFEASTEALSVFEATTHDFAPVGTPNSDGSVTFTWTAPEGVTGDAKVIVTGDDYMKTFTATGSSVTVADLKKDASYKIQAIVGDAASKLLTYANVITPVTDKVSYSEGGRGDFDDLQWRKGGVYEMYNIDLRDMKDTITSKGGLIFKWKTEFNDTYNIELKYDQVIEGQPTSYPLENAWLSYSSILRPVDITEDGYWIENRDFDGSTMGSNSSYLIDTAAKKVLSYNQSGKAIPANVMHTWPKPSTDAVGMQNPYIMIPFDHSLNGAIEKFQDTGIINYTVENLYLAAWKERPDTSGWSGEILSYKELTDASKQALADAAAAGDTELQALFTTDVNQDGEITYTFGDFPEGQLRNPQFFYKTMIEEVYYVSDYAAFITSNVDTEAVTVSTDVPQSDVLVPDGQHLISNGFELYSPAAVTTGKYLNYNDGYQFTVAAGETAKIGFTVQADGLYEFTNEFSGDDTQGIYYRVYNKGADGSANLLKETTAYTVDDNSFVVLADAKAGDTLYIEAWSDTDGAVIGMGLPRAAHKTNIAEDGITYTSKAGEAFIAKASDGIDHSGVIGSHESEWELGYYINPVTVTKVEGSTDTSLGDVTVYDATSFYNNAYVPFLGTTNDLKQIVGSDGVSKGGGTINTKGETPDYTLDYDGLGVADLAVGDDGSTLLGAVTEMNHFGYNGGYYPQDLHNVIGNYYQSNHTGLGLFNLSNASQQYNNIAVAASDYLTARWGFNQSVMRYRGTYTHYTYYDEEKGEDVSVTSANPYLGNANLGLAITYTAPVDADVVFTFPIYKGSNNIVLDNDGKVIYADSSANGTASLELEMAKGESVTWTLGATTGASAFQKLIAQPTVQVTPKTVSLKVDGEGVDTTEDLVAGRLTPGTTITFPGVHKTGYLFRYWYDAEDNQYIEGDELTIDADTVLYQYFDLFGDLDMDAEVSGADALMLKQFVLGFESEDWTPEAEELSDVTGDGNVDIRDIVRIKKYLAGVLGTVLGE